MSFVDSIPVATPEWHKADRVHDWRNYIGPRTQALWSTFSQEQQLAIAQDAAERAGAEDWD